MKTLHIQEAKRFDTEKTTVVTMSKETCVLLIKDLVEDLANTGVGKLVLQTNENEYLIFKLGE